MHAARLRKGYIAEANSGPTPVTPGRRLGHLYCEWQDLREQFGAVAVSDQHFTTQYFGLSIDMVKKQIQTAFLLGLLWCASSAIVRAQCSSNQWCRVYSRSTQNFGPGLQDNGWHNIFFAQDENNPSVGQFFLEAAGNVTSGTSNPQPTLGGPLSNSVFSFTALKNTNGQPVLATSPPFTEVSDCGDVGSTFARPSLQQHLYLQSAMSASSTSATFCVGSPSSSCAGASGFTLPASGTIWVNDETIDYTSLSCDDSSGNCSTSGATHITFNFSLANRGQRQVAGWTGPTAHSANAFGGLSCPKTAYGPRLNGALTTDAPTSRHPGGGLTYDSKRGRIWQTWGWQETWSFQDTWYLCVYQSAYCSTSQIADGWFHVNLSGNPGLPFPSPGGENPQGYSENDQIYVPDFDVLYEFGGLRMGAISDAWIYCLSTDALPVMACHSDLNPANSASLVLNQWLPVCNTRSCHGTLSAPVHGDPGVRDGARLTYDPVDQKVLIFGGRSGQSGTPVYWTSVAQWDPRTNDYCLSDTSQSTTQIAEFSGQNCSLPALTGPPPSAGLPVYFPDWTWDSKRNVAVVLADALYTYDPGHNSWTLTGVTGGPATDLNRSEQGLAYDSANDMYVAIAHPNTGFEVWELAGTGLSNAVVPGFVLTVSPVSRNISAGGSATFSLSIKPKNGQFSGTVSLACGAGLPSGGSCSFSPSSVVPGTNGASSTLTVRLPSGASGSYVINLNATSGSLQSSNAVNVISGSPQFLLQASPAALSVSAGQAATAAVTVTGQNGFSGAVNLACAAGLPAGATCSFSPSSVSAGTTPMTATLTISVPSATLLPGPLHRSGAPLWAFWLAVVPGVVLATGAGERSRKRTVLLALLLGMIVLVGMVGCGGGSTGTGNSAAPPPPPGPTPSSPNSTYNVVIVGTSGSMQQSAQIALTVQ